MIGDVIAFDVDGTIAQSCQVISEEMWNELTSYDGVRDLVLISGSSVDEIVKQLPIDPNEVRMHQIYIVGTSGAEVSCVTWCPLDHAFSDGDGWDVERISTSELSDRQLRFAYRFLADIRDRFPESVALADSRSDIVLRRPGGVTLSLLGRGADKSTKDLFDPSGARRFEVVQHVISSYGFNSMFVNPDGGDINILEEMGLKCRVGGTTSIDIFRSDVSKLTGLRKVLFTIARDPADVIFFGDRLDGDGNDSDVRDHVLAFQVRDPQHTLDLLRTVRLPKRQA